MRFTNGPNGQPALQRLEEAVGEPRPARELRERDEGERGAEPRERPPEAPPGAGEDEGRRRRLVQQQEGEHERDPAARRLGVHRRGPARERRELEQGQREEGEAREEKRPAGEGRLAQVDRPAERVVGRVRLDDQPAARHVEGDVVRAEPLPQAAHRHRAGEPDRGRDEAGDPEDRVGPGVHGAEGQDGARDDQPQRRLERALQPAHDAGRAQQVGRGDGDGARLRGFAHGGAGDDTTPAEPCHSEEPVAR